MQLSQKTLSKKSFICLQMQTQHHPAWWGRKWLDAACVSLTQAKPSDAADMVWCKMVQGDTSSLSNTQTHHCKHRATQRDTEMGNKALLGESLTNLAAMEDLSPSPASFIHSFRQQQQQRRRRQGSWEKRRRRSWTGLLLNPCQRVHAWGLVINRQLHCPFQEMQFSGLKRPELHASCLSPPRLFFPSFFLQNDSQAPAAAAKPPFVQVLPLSVPRQPIMPWLDATAESWRLLLLPLCTVLFQHRLHVATPTAH